MCVEAPEDDEGELWTQAVVFGKVVERVFENLIGLSIAEASQRSKALLSSEINNKFVEVTRSGPS
jgi:hypothetical protein